MIKRIAEDANRSCIKQNTVLPTEVPNGNNTHDDMDIATDGTFSYLENKTLYHKYCLYIFQCIDIYVYLYIGI